MITEIWGEINGKKILKGFSKIVEGEDVMGYTDEWLKELQLLHDTRRLVRSGLDPSVLELSFKGYQGDDPLKNIPKLEGFVKDFDKKMSSAHMYLWSKFNSTQKTTTAKILAKELLLQGKSVQFITFGELSKTLKNQEYDEQALELSQTCLEVDFLVLDDCFDPRKMTLFKSGYQLSFIDIFLRDRLETQRKSTCFTSNFSISEISGTFGPSIQALVERSVLPLEFNDSVNKADLRSLWES